MATQYQLILKCLKEIEELRNLVEQWLGEDESDDGSDVDVLGGDTDEEGSFEEREESQRRLPSASWRKSGGQ